MKPRAKRSGMLSEPLEDELIVYDQDRDRAHCLNRTAALVWGHADGEHTIAELATILRTELDGIADEDLVWHAIDCLKMADLLEEPPPRSRDAMRTSRRQFISKVGVIGVASLLLPVITSVAAPPAAQAGGGCGTSSGSSGGFSTLLAERLTGK